MGKTLTYASESPTLTKREKANKLFLKGKCIENILGPVYDKKNKFGEY
jgi:hypothetical protein